MIRKVYVLLILMLTLTGCKEAPEILDTKYFEVPMKDCKVLSIEIPADWNLMEQDGFYYWKLSPDTTVYKTEVPVHVGKLDGECYYTATSVSRNFDYGTVTINTTREMVPYMVTKLNEAELFERQVLQYKELVTTELPEYEDLPMHLTNNGLYMPTDCEDVLSLAFTAANTIKGESFVGSWLMNSKLEDLKPYLHNIVTCNTEDNTLSKWYESGDVYYAVSENKVVAAKKLTYNQWYCYVASIDDYSNYVVKAMHDIDVVK